MVHWLAIAGALAVPSHALAHGGFFRAHHILVDPADERSIAVRSDAWGFVASSDGGASWTWICGEAFGRRSSSPLRIAAASVPGRTLLASLGDGMQRSSRDVCGWSAATGFEDELVRDVRRVAEDRLLAVSTRSVEGGPTRARLWVSSDGGDAWTQLGGELPEGFAATSAAATPDATRLYAVARAGETVQVARSEDAGESWQVASFNVAVDALGFDGRIAGIDPSDADTLYLLVDASDAMGSQDVADTLMVSRDGGRAFEPLVQSAGDLAGFAFAPDGERIAVGGEREGLLVARTDALADGGREAFEPWLATPVYGLTWTARGLYVGGDEWSGQGGFTLAITRDGGSTFESLLSLCDVTLRECAADTSAGAVCPLIFSDMGERGGAFKEDFLDSPHCQGSDAVRPDAGAMADAGDPEPAAGADSSTGPLDADREMAPGDASASKPSGTGCGCRVAAPRTGERAPSSGPGVALLGLALVALAGLRRVRAPRRRSSCAPGRAPSP